MTEARLRKARNSCAWMMAYLDCLEEKRPVSIIKTHWQLQGLLL